MPDETNEMDWAAREEELLALNKTDLMAVASGADLDASGNKADIAARIIAAEQDALAPDEGDESNGGDDAESSDETTADGDINVDADAVVDVTDDAAKEDADDDADEADDDAEDDADTESQEGIGDDASAPDDAPSESDLAIGDAMADVAAEEAAEQAAADAEAAADRAAELAAEEAAAAKAAGDHEVAHSMAVPATPGTVVTLDPDRLVKAPKIAEAWDELQKNILADLEDQSGDLFKDASDAAKFLGEFSQKLAKYKYKAATARDTFQKRMFEQNLKHLEAQAATEAARMKQKLVKSGDIMLERILKITIKAVTGAALGALL